MDVERIMAEKVRYKPSANGTEEFKLSRGPERRAFGVLVGNRAASRRVLIAGNRSSAFFSFQHRVLLGPNRD